MKNLLLVLCLFTFSLQAQNNYKVGAVGFYNLENLFDLEDTPDVRDTEFTPNGGKGYTKEVYDEKLEHLTRVISELGTELSPDGVAVLGVCEIENRSVLEDLVSHPRIADRRYQIVHHDSPDKRGIDVGLIYNPTYYTVTGSKNHPVYLYNSEGERKFTRDVLHVAGDFDGEPMHFLVNHWPSRSGGEKRSAPFRNEAAKVCKHIVDSLTNINPNVKVFIMGDLNDDPFSPSVKKTLNAKRYQKDVAPKGLYNPMYDMHKKGMGTLAWRDTWSLFDQIIMTSGALKGNSDNYFFHQANIYNPKYMVQKSGQYKGYPFRTYAGDSYQGGYSDHFPVFIYLLKKV